MYYFLNYSKKVYQIDFLKEATLISKISLTILTLFVLIVTSAYAQDWGYDPLTRKTSNDTWYNAPMAGNNYDNWANSPLNPWNNSEFQWNVNKKNNYRKAEDQEVIIKVWEILKDHDAAPQKNIEKKIAQNSDEASSSQIESFNYPSVSESFKKESISKSQNNSIIVIGSQTDFKIIN